MQISEQGQEIEAKKKAEFMEKHKPRINPHVWLILGLLCFFWLMHRKNQEERIQQAKLAKSNAIFYVEK